MAKAKRTLIIGATIIVCFIAGYFLLWQQMEMKTVQVIFTAEIPSQCKNWTYITNRSEYIIEGKVEKVRVEHPHERETPVTYTNIRIEKYIKGDLKSSEIQVVIDWARVEAVSTQLETFPYYLRPSLVKGENVTIYFEKEDGKYFITCSVFGISRGIKG